MPMRMKLQASNLSNRSRFYIKGESLAPARNNSTRYDDVCNYANGDCTGTGRYGGRLADDTVIGSFYMFSIHVLRFFSFCQLSVISLCSVG